MRLRNHFETGAQGSRVTAYGSSNPYAWDFVNGSVTNTTYDNTHARGQMAGKFLTGGTAAAASAQWTPAGGQYGTQTGIYGRMYVWLTALPAADCAIMRSVDTGGSMACRVTVQADGQLKITQASGALGALSGATHMPVSQWVRIEWHILHSATVGTVALKAWWTDPESTGAPDVSLSATGQNTGVSSGGAHFGWCDNIANAPAMWLDAIEVNTAGWVGPSVAEPAASFKSWLAPVLGPIDQSNESQNAVGEYVTRLMPDVVPSRLMFVAEPRRRGAMSLRMELHQFDVTGGGGSERLTLNRTAPDYGPGDDFWFGISVLLDPTYPPGIPGGWVVLYQLFGMTGGQTTGSPPFALEIGSNGFFQMAVRGGVKAGGGDAAPRESFQNITPITNGVWHDFLFHLHLSTGSDGTVDCFYKPASDSAWPASPTVSDTGINILTVAGVVQRTFNSMNVYRATRPEVGVVYFGLAVVEPDRELVEAYFVADTDVRLPGAWGVSQ